MSVLRKVFYSDGGNRIARVVAAPFKKIIPVSLQFPVSGTIRVKIAGAASLRLTVNPTCYLGKVLFWKGVAGFESGMHRVFKDLVTRTETFLDIGANIGFYSLLAYRYNPQIRIISFEPLPAAFKYLILNRAQNGAGTIDAHPLALSNESKSATFFFSLNPKFLFVQDQLTSTGSLDRTQADRTRFLKQISIEQMSLDRFCEEIPLEGIDLIKLDTEATEHLVLDGAASTIQKHRPIILCEVLPGRIENEIQSRVEAMDYLAFNITDLGLKQITDLSHETGSTNDHLFCPREKLDTIQHLISKD